MDFREKIQVHTPLICYICGDTARGMNFEVITCMSCKAFFRRHALRTTKIRHCLMNKNCPITKQTRSGCSACRLKKCFAFGMNPNLIRVPDRYSAKPDMSFNLPKPKPISLLNHDRSTLTLEEWNLLSNVVHAYDEQNLAVRVQFCLKEQASLPLKVRTKQVNTLELIGMFYTAVQPFIERCPYFHALPVELRKMIIQNNLNGTGGFNSMLGASEANVFDNDHHIIMCNQIYGTEYMKGSIALMYKIETNRTLVKIMLMVLAFSSNCSIVNYDRKAHTPPLSKLNTYVLCRIQDVFISMMWKYLIYQYGYVEAIRRLLYLVKNYLDVLRRMDENHSTQHWDMVDDIVEKTAYLVVTDA